MGSYWKLAKHLKETDGISAEVINIHTIKPLRYEMLY